MMSPFKADPHAPNTVALDLYLVVATLPSDTDRPQKYKYEADDDDDPNVKNE